MLATFRRPARALAALALAFGLTGCFDYEQHLTLKGSGGGTLEVKLRIDPAFRGALETETLLPPQLVPIEVKREIKDGQYVQSEKVSFKALSELRVHSETLSITNHGATLFGVGPKQLTLHDVVDTGSEDIGSFGPFGGPFQDRVYAFSVTIPGWIQKAYPLLVGNESVAPTINGSTVTWRIPMVQALTAGRLEYRLDFLAFMDIPAEVAAQRVDGEFIKLPLAGSAARRR
jgi:hypothetical protein